MGLLELVSFRFLLVFCSALLFHQFSVLLSILAPASVISKDLGKWKNFGTSFTHSVLAGAGSVICFIENPKLTDDIKNSYTQFSMALLCLSVGYFIFDTIREFAESGSKSRPALVIHHVVIVLNFCIPLYRSLYTYVATITLIVEVNSIFLHLRMLLKICNFPKSGFWFSFINTVNLCTFIPFRYLPIFYMTMWTEDNRQYGEWHHIVLVYCGLISIPIINTVILYRLLQSDAMDLKRKFLRLWGGVCRIHGSI